MAEFANIVAIDVNPGATERVLEALLAHKERSLRDEPGTLQFKVLRPSGEDHKLLTYELYRDEAAFAEHRAAPSLAQLLAETRDLVSGLQGTGCLVQD